METYEMRLRRIQLQNQQLEKRHKEVEADKQRAMRDNGVSRKEDFDDFENMMPAERAAFLERHRRNPPPRDILTVAVTFNQSGVSSKIGDRRLITSNSSAPTSNLYRCPPSYEKEDDDDDDNDDDTFFKNIKTLSPTAICSLRREKELSGIGGVDEISSSARNLTIADGLVNNSEDSSPCDNDVFFGFVPPPLPTQLSNINTVTAGAPVDVLPQDNFAPPSLPLFPNYTSSSFPDEELDFLPDMDLSKPPPPLGFETVPRVPPYRPLNDIVCSPANGYLNEIGPSPVTENVQFSSPVFSSSFIPGNASEIYDVNTPDRGSLSSSPFVPIFPGSSARDYDVCQPQPPDNVFPAKTYRPLLGRTDGDQTPATHAMDNLCNKFSPVPGSASMNSNPNNGWEYASGHMGHIPYESQYQRSIDPIRNGDLSHRNVLVHKEDPRCPPSIRNKRANWEMTSDYSPSVASEFSVDSWEPPSDASSVASELTSAPSHVPSTSSSDNDKRTFRWEDDPIVITTPLSNSSDTTDTGPLRWEDDPLPEPDPPVTHVPAKKKSALYSRMEAARNDNSKRFSRAHVMDKMKVPTWDLSYNGQTVTISNDDGAQEKIRSLISGNDSLEPF